MAELSWRRALEHLPWLLILAPIAIAPLTVALERLLRSRRAERRAAHKRAGLGEAHPRLRAALSDSHEPLTALGTLRADDVEPVTRPVAMSWFASTGPASSVHRRSSTRWRLELDDASLALDGPLAVLAGSHETASGTPLQRALDWARLPERESDDAERDVEGQARLVHDGDRVRVRGILVVEPAEGDAPESYRTRHLAARLVPCASHLQLVTERAPRVSLRPAFVRVARMTVMTAIAFAVIPALVVTYLQWRSMRDDVAQRHACEDALERASAEHRPWDAAEPARRCGSDEAKANVAWHNGEVAEAALQFRRRRSGWAEPDIHATNAASQIIAGHYPNAALIVRRMAAEDGPHRGALGCIAAGLSLMHRASDDAVGNRDAAAELRRGAADELRTLHATSDSAPIACIALLADRLGETEPLQEVVRAIEGGAAPGYLNSYLAALLAAEPERGLSLPLLASVVDAHHPPLAAQKPRSWALTHPVAVSTALLRAHPPRSANERRIAAALAAQNALFDAYMGQEQVAIKTLKPVLDLALEVPPSAGAANDALLIGAAAAILVDSRVVAEALLQAVPQDDERVAALRARLELAIPPYDRSVFARLDEEEHGLAGSVLWRAAAGDDDAAHSSALAQTPVSAVHGFIPFVALSLRPAPTNQWLTHQFPTLCETCGLRALAEHIASRRVAAVALGDPMAHHLAHPARRLHGAMLRRDIAVPLYLLEWIVETELQAAEHR